MVNAISTRGEDVRVLFRKLLQHSAGPVLAGKLGIELVLDLGFVRLRAFPVLDELGHLVGADMADSAVLSTSVQHKAHGAQGEDVKANLLKVLSGDWFPAGESGLVDDGAVRQLSIHLPKCLAVIFARGGTLSALEASPGLRGTGDLDVHFGIATVGIGLMRISGFLWSVQGEGRDDSITFDIVKLVVGPLEESALAVNPDIDLLKKLTSDNDVMSSSIT